jgi:hypothetical protein
MAAPGSRFQGVEKLIFLMGKKLIFCAKTFKLFEPHKMEL